MDLILYLKWSIRNDLKLSENWTALKLLCKWTNFMVKVYQIWVCLEFTGKVKNLYELRFDKLSNIFPHCSPIFSAIIFKWTKKSINKGLAVKIGVFAERRESSMIHLSKSLSTGSHCWLFNSVSSSNGDQKVNTFWTWMCVWRMMSRRRIFLMIALLQL